MLKAVISWGAKRPANERFSSDQVFLSVEEELPMSLHEDEIRKVIHNKYALVRSIVESEIAGEGGKSRQKPTRIEDDPFNRNQKSDQRQNLRATQKQVAYLGVLSNELGIPLSEINARASELYGVTSLYELKRSDATKLIDSLKDHAFKAA